MAGHAHAKLGDERLQTYWFMAGAEIALPGKSELYLESGGMCLGERHSAWLGTVVGTVDVANLAQLLFEIA